jgi:hypothetical protein
MFKTSKDKENIVPENKTEDNVSHDFITHNMPAPHRFSGQTFSNGSAAKSDRAINVSGAQNHKKVGFLIITGGLIMIFVLLYLGYSYFIKPSLNQPVAEPATKIATETPTEIHNFHLYYNSIHLILKL